MRGRLGVRRGRHQIRAAGLQTHQQTAVDPGGDLDAGAEAVGLIEVGDGGRRVHSSDARVEAQPQRAFAVPQRVVHRVGRQPVLAAHGQDAVPAVIQHEQAGARRLESDRRPRQDQTAVHLRRRDDRSRVGHKRRHHRAVVQEQPILARCRPGGACRRSAAIPGRPRRRVRSVPGSGFSAPPSRTLRPVFRRVDVDEPVRPAARGQSATAAGMTVNVSCRPDEDFVLRLEEHPVRHHERAPHVGERGRALRQLVGDGDVIEAAVAGRLQVAERAVRSRPKSAPRGLPSASGSSSRLQRQSEIDASWRRRRLEHGAVGAEEHHPTTILEDAPRLRAAADFKRRVRPDERSALFKADSGAG